MDKIEYEFRSRSDIEKLPDDVAKRFWRDFATCEEAGLSPLIPTDISKTVLVWEDYHQFTKENLK